MVLHSQPFLNVLLKTAFRLPFRPHLCHTAPCSRSIRELLSQQLCPPGLTRPIASVPQHKFHDNLAPITRPPLAQPFVGHGESAFVEEVLATRAGEGVEKLSVKRDEIEDYLKRRQAGPSFLRKFRPVTFVRIMRQATTQRLHGVAKSIASDVVAMAKMQSEEGKSSSMEDAMIKHRDYSRTASMLLEIACRREILDDETVIELFKVASSPSVQPSTPHQPPYHLTLLSLSSILVAITRRPSNWALDRHLNTLHAINHAIHEGIKSLSQAPTASRDVLLSQLALTRITRAMFKFIRFMLARDGESHWALAYEALEVVVNCNLLPAGTVREEDKETEHIPTIILSPLIRTCVIQGWTLDAAALLEALPCADGKSKEHFEGLFEDVVCSLLDLPGGNGVKRSAELIQFAFERVPEFYMNVEVMQSLYDTACSTGLIEIGATLYFQLRSRYPAQTANLLPRGRSLLWSLKTFLKNSSNLDGAKLLAQHIVECRPRIARHTVPKVISLCVEAGLVEESRQLWEDYSRGADKEIVAGNPRLVVSILKLLTTESKRQSIRRERYGPGESADELVEHVSGGYQDTWSGTSSPSRAGSEEQIWREDSEGDLRQRATISGSVIENVRVVEADSPDSIADPQISSEEEGVISAQFPSNDNNTNSCTDQTKIFSESGEDYPGTLVMEESEKRQFAHRVLEEFEAAKAPLIQATHLDLNAVARARAILGDFQGSLNALRIVIDRKEVPDIHDINVVVEGLARHDPARAAKVVENMVELSVMPDNITFASLINSALDHGNMALARRTFAQAKALGIKQLTPATITRLVKVSLKKALRYSRNQSTKHDQGKLLERVQRSYDVVASELYPRNIFPVELGVQGVEAALQAESGELAYKFWRTLVHGRLDATSTEEVDVRRRIATRIRVDCEKGELEQCIGHKYTDDLGEGSQER